MRFLFPLVLIFTAIGLGLYAYLGGLHTPTVALETTAAPVLLAGQPYAGKAEDQRFGELFREAKTIQESGRLGSRALTLANLYYNNPEKARDTIRAFIGVAVADTTHTLPAGWRYRVVPAGRRVVASRISNTSYMLAPSKLYTAAEEMVKTQKLTKQPPYFEQFGPGDTSELWLGVK
ncbi:MAG: GyrI-like domain-containing protein [Janthinobacterium lividum]